MTAGTGDREDFLDWFRTTWRAAESALHDGDARPRDRTWSRRPPVTLFGAWMEADGPEEVREVFARLAASFSDVASAEVDLVAADVGGDLAYTVHREVTSTSVDGRPRDYVLRVTQVYRREAAGWKVVHRHADGGPTREARRPAEG
ncbi:YybH family protein [Isoptericola sp. NPDC056573]|uniref:YybH family protein n=1 Tax=unclassified Isoptericola TaxID=2623355 RepID=UPI00368EA1D1